PTVLEASRVLSQKLCAENTSANDKITKAFRLIICRTPEVRELQILQGYYNDQLNLFKQKLLYADTTLQQGEYPNDDKLDENSEAALMKVISMIYNLEEAITKT